jgi:hypothetical protein
MNRRAIRLFDQGLVEKQEVENKIVDFYKQKKKGLIRNIVNLVLNAHLVWRVTSEIDDFMRRLVFIE